MNSLRFTRPIARKTASESDSDGLCPHAQALRQPNLGTTETLVTLLVKAEQSDLRASSRSTRRLLPHCRNTRLPTRFPLPRKEPGRSHFGLRPGQPAIARPKHLGHQTVAKWTVLESRVANRRGAPSVRRTDRLRHAPVPNPQQGSGVASGQPQAKRPCRRDPDRPYARIHA